MISLHHLECSRSFRILWALEELGLDYDIHYYQRLPNYSAPETLKCIHPLGKAPILTDDEQVIAESAVILEYLQQRYDQNQQFKPTQAQNLQQYIYWMHYAEGSLMPLLVMTLVMNSVNKHVPWLIQPVAKKITEGVKANFVRPRMKDHISFLENYLAEHEYFAGDFSFADIQMSFPLEALQSRLQGKYPNIQAFLHRIRRRVAFQKAKKKGIGSNERNCADISKKRNNYLFLFYLYFTCV